MRRTRIYTVFTFVLVVTGCSDTSIDEGKTDETALGGDSELRALFLDAESQSGVPAEILATVAYTETRLRFVGSAEYGHGHTPSVFGMMGLTDGGPRDIARAAGRLGVDASELYDDLRLNVYGAALLLGDLAEQVDDKPQSLSEWRDVVALWGGESVALEVMKRIDQGWRGLDVKGEWLILTARPTVGADVGDGIGSLSQAVGYPSALWNAAHSSNYSNGSRGASQINYIVIHTVQGSYSGCISWFKNSSSNVSSHYVARSSDGQITQMVDDTDVAWHDACFNSETIGIEHEGYVGDPDLWYTEAMYMESARLTAWLADQYGIPKDRDHIMGHGEAPDCSSHTDPGSGWDWTHYMELVNDGGQATFDAIYEAMDHPMRMESGDEAVVWMEFKNESNVTWGLNETRLGTAEPRDRESAFFVDGNWLGVSRATGADHSNYGPGSTGRFTFLIRAPEVDEPTIYNESFQLVQESVTWFGPVATMNIEVVPAGWSDPVDPDPNDPAPVDPTDPDPTNPDGDDVAGGCSAGGAPASGCAILLLGALLVSTRRRWRRLPR